MYTEKSTREVYVYVLVQAPGRAQLQSEDRQQAADICNELVSEQSAGGKHVLLTCLHFFTFSLSSRKIPCRNKRSPASPNIYRVLLCVRSSV